MIHNCFSVEMLNEERGCYMERGCYILYMSYTCFIDLSATAIYPQLQ